MRTSLMSVAVAAGALALSGCGGDTSTTTAADTTAGATTTQATATAPPATTAAPKPTTITVVVKGGHPQGGIERPTIDKGTKVVLVVRTDAGEAVHLHGYNLEQPVTPGKPLRIAFTATLPGRFELELHHPDVVLAVLEVRP